MVEDLDKRIWMLLSGQLDDPQETRSAVRVLNEELIPKVIGVLKKMGVDAITAEGIATEAVDRAVRTYRPGGAKFLTFVTKIALNIRIDRFRRGLLAPRTISGEEAIPPDSLSYDLNDVAETHEESRVLERIRTVFPLLSETDRILIRFDIQGVPNESFMEIFGISATAYRQRKSRAYARLRRFYERSER